MCLDQGRNSVPLVWLEPAIPRSLVKQSTTELPSFFFEILKRYIIYGILLCVSMI